MSYVDDSDFEISSMMDRVLEPEIMDDPEQARIYAAADFSEENALFVDQFLLCAGELDDAHIVDLGCGPADIPIRLAKRCDTVRVTGIDASPPMIAIARQAVERAGLNERIQLCCQRFQDVVLPEPADGVISNSLVHHVRNPLQFWYAVKRMAKPGSPVLVMDLLRPDSPEAARELVERYAANEPKRLQEDFYRSLLAAFTEDEVAAHLAELNLTRLLVDVVDDRHWIVSGRL